MFPTVMGMMMNKMNYYAQLNCYINEFTSCHLDYNFADIFLESQKGFMYCKNNQQVKC